MTNCKLSQKKIFGPQLSEEEVLDMIQAAPGLYSRYTSLSEQLKDEFLGFCMGTRGLNLTYDPCLRHYPPSSFYPDWGASEPVPGRTNTDFESPAHRV